MLFPLSTPPQHPSWRKLKRKLPPYCRHSQAPSGSSRLRCFNRQHLLRSSLRQVPRRHKSKHQFLLRHASRHRGQTACEPQRTLSSTQRRLSQRLRNSPRRRSTTKLNSQWLPLPHSTLDSPLLFRHSSLRMICKSSWLGPRIRSQMHLAVC